MKHEYYWDADNACIRLDLHGTFDVDDVKLVFDRLPSMVEAHGCRVMLVDHSDSRMALPADTREYLRVHAGDADIDRLAFFGMSNLTRITAQIIMHATGNRYRARFCKTEALAVTWLHE